MTELARIAVVRTFGPPQNIKIEEHPLAPLRAGEVRVAVRTGGLNPVDARRRAGKFGGNVPMVLGTEHAGVIHDSKDPSWPVGMEVIGWGTSGADADLATTDGSRLFPKPAGLDWNLAGGLSGVGQTALTALNALSLQPGNLVVVHGASGGVGTVLAQMAISRGLKVIGTASASNQDYLRKLGATAVEYGPGLSERILAAAGGQPIVASIDLAGSHEAGDVCVAVMRAGGQAITLVPETMTSHSLRLVQVRHSPEQLKELLDAVAAGGLVLPVESFPFLNIVQAHERLDSKHAQGKIVLNISDNPYLPETARKN